MIAEIEKAIEVVAKSIQKEFSSEHCEKKANTVFFLANAITLLRKPEAEKMPACEPSETPHQFTPFEEKIIESVKSIKEQIERDNAPKQEQCDEVEFLFIGGPMDGFRYSVDPNQETFEYSSNSEWAAYTKHIFKFPMGQCQFFVLKGMDPVQVVERLLTRYAGELRVGECTP